MTEQQWGVGNKAQGKAFDKTKVGNQEYELFFGEHPHGRSDHNIYARSDSGRIEEFDGHRRLIDIKIISYNYLKESELSGDQIRKGVTIQIFSDGEQVWEDFHRDPLDALLKARELLQKLESHETRWLYKEEREALVGRKIFYREIPCVIERVIVDQGCLIIRREDGEPFPPAVYVEAGEYYEKELTVKDEIFSKHIWWWRK